MKSLQGLILYHLRGATCSTAIIGMDGTATISRKRRGAASENEGERRARERRRETTEMNRGGEGESEGDGQRGNKLERGQRSQTLGCQTHANDDTQCVATTQRGRKINKIFLKKETRQRQVSYDTAMSIQPLVCASLAAFQDLDSSTSLHPPAVSNLPMC